jgi:formylmethanofuran dehydrogenase subunit B
LSNTRPVHALYGCRFERASFTASLQYDPFRICCESNIRNYKDVCVHEGCTLLHSADSRDRSKHVNTNTNTTRDGRPNKCFAL